jgi:hypothetical protein
MKIALLSIVGLGFLNYAQAAPITVTCQGIYKGKTGIISLKLDDKNKIIQWSRNKLANTPAGSIFENFSYNLADEPYDYMNSFMGRNGYSIIEIGSTADAEQIGVHLGLKKGFYSYRDHGSGNGNFNIVLVCK